MTTLITIHLLQPRDVYGLQATTTTVSDESNHYLLCIFLRKTLSYKLDALMNLQ